MKLKDNPVFTYGMRIHWRGWRLWVFPAVCVTLLCISVAIMLADGPMAQVLARMFPDKARQGMGNLLSPMSPAVVTWQVYTSVLNTAITWMAVLFVPGLSVSIMMREYTRGAMGLLKTSRLTPAEIAHGKLGVASAPFVLAIMFSLPLTAIAVGVDFHIGMTAVLITVRGIARVIAYSMIGLWVSARTARMSSAMFFAYLYSLVIVGLVELGGVIFTALLLLSTVQQNMARATPAYWSSLSHTLVYVTLVIDTVILLVAAVYAGNGLRRQLAMPDGLKDRQVWDIESHVRYGEGRDGDSLRSDGFARF